MFYKLTGIPEEGDIVLCQVTKIYPNSVFVNIVEYSDSGMIHISEISPGRIRNIRDYVSVGRQIVCKVLRINKERGHIDLSLRRVNSTQRRNKLEEVKQELKAESLIKNLSKKLKSKPEILYKKISKVVLKEYSHLFECFMDITMGECDVLKMGLDEKIAKSLTEAVKEKFKEPKIIFQGEISLSTYSVDGLERVRNVLFEIEKVTTGLKLFYLGAGRYKFSFEEKDYKIAEDNLTEIQKILENFNDNLSTSTFSRRKAEIEE